MNTLTFTERERLQVAMDGEGFYCQNKRLWYARPLFTPVMCLGQLVCKEANNERLKQWRDGSYHWTAEYPDHSKYYKTAAEKKTELRTALEEACKSVEKQTA